MDGRTILKRTLALLGIMIVLGYSYFVLDDFVRGPRIVIDSPRSGFSTTTPAIVIRGRGIHTNNLAVNDAQTAVDLDGNFRSQLILAPGYNIIKVSAKDNYGRIVEKTIEMNLVGEHLTTDLPATAYRSNEAVGRWQAGAATRTIDGNTGTTTATTTQATSTINNF